MLGHEAAKAIIERVLRFSQAPETEVLLSSRDAALTRFAHNVIHQNVAEHDITMTIRAVEGGRIGLATTNGLDDDSLVRAAGYALAHARLQPEDLDFAGLIGPRPVQPVHAFDDATAACDPAARAEAVGLVCRLAAERGLFAFGALRTNATEIALGNSHGAWAYHPGTVADLQAVVMGEDGSAWAQASGWQFAALDAEALGREAVDRALRAQHPRPLPPGEYTIVAEPYVTDDLLNVLNFFGMGAGDVADGRSWMSERLGQQVFSPLVSIWDDGRNLRGAPQPFDAEGTPRQRVQIAERGVLAGPVYDRATARQAGRESTGHAAPPGDALSSGPLAHNLFMAPGDSSVPEMIAQVERGLYVNRFWYPRPVNLRECVITATTRDALFWIEGGEIAYPVQNLRFTHSYVQALANVRAVGRETYTLIDDSGSSTCVPALLIDGWRFVG